MRKLLTTMRILKNPGALAGATGADKPNHTTAAGTQFIAHRPVTRHRAGTPYMVTPTAGDPMRIVVSGRLRWALEELRNAGGKGCTPIENPAPRWSAYVHDLRKLGVEIETITEPHEGDFPGHHARYVLRAGVALNWEGGAA